MNFVSCSKGKERGVSFQEAQVADGLLCLGGPFMGFSCDRGWTTTPGLERRRKVGHGMTSEDATAITEGGAGGRGGVKDVRVLAG